MPRNANLNSAARAKKDEFYTQLSDIENELRHYENHFVDKTVFCNCDDPFESQFFFYFAMKFNYLRLKKLIVTSYTGSPVQGNLFSPCEGKPAYKVEINRIDKEPLDWQGVTEIMNELKVALAKNDSATIDGNTLSILKGDGNYLAGDFRSVECVKLLEEADIVVTNPPFSLFREYVAQLMNFIDKLPTAKAGGLCYLQPMLLMKAKSDLVSCKGRCPNPVFLRTFSFWSVCPTLECRHYS